MQRTLIIYEGVGEVTEKIVKKMALILGPSRYCSTKDFKEDYKNYDLFVIACPVSGEKVDEKILKFLIENASWLINKKIGLICTGVEENEGIKALKKLQVLLGVAVIHCKTVKCDKCDDQIVQFSLEVKRIRESFFKTMPKTELKNVIDTFITSHKSCDLATGYNSWIRSTPVEYVYKNGSIYILSEGGKKFANILVNNRVSLSIYEPFESIEKLVGMQIRGKATILDENSKDFKEILKKKSINNEYIKERIGTLNCIKIDLEKVEFLSYKFKDLGYDTKQIYYYDEI